MSRPELYKFDSINDPRGNLAYLEELKDVPFEIKRTYWLYDVPEQQIRGNHAHHSSQQVIICIQGEIKVLLESTEGEKLDFHLNRPNEGLLIPPLWWGKMVFSKNALMIGLASDEYGEEDYIRKREEFDGL